MHVHFFGRQNEEPPQLVIVAVKSQAAGGDLSLTSEEDYLATVENGELISQAGINTQQSFQLCVLGFCNLLCCVLVGGKLLLQ